MTTYLGKSCSFGFPRVPFVNCRQFMYLVISLLVLRAGCGIWLYQFLIIAYLFTFQFIIIIENTTKLIFVFFSFRGNLILRNKNDVMPVEKSRNWALILSNIPNKPCWKFDMFTLKIAWVIQVAVLMYCVFLHIYLFLSASFSERSAN